MEMQQQRAQDQAMFDRLKGVMGSAADSLPGATKLKGYAQVGTSGGVMNPDDFGLEEEESSGGSREDPRDWTSREVCSYLRQRLLEFEGADEETVDELLRTFEEREVDGAMLLELDDHQLRYELDMGAVIVRETLLRIIDGLKEKQRKVKANAVQASALRAKSKKKNSAAAASEDDSDSDQSEPISSDDDDDSDDGDSGDHAGKRMNAPRSKREKEAAAAAKARARQSRDAKRKAEQQELELTMLVRVGASVSALSVVYSLLAQSLESWHHRSVKMSGPNEDMEFATSLGIWSFSSKGHYHNDNMYSKLVPESSGFEWSDDYHVTDTYANSKWQCAHLSENAAVKEFCGALHATQAMVVLGFLCAMACLGHSLVGVSYGRPIGCSKIMAAVSVGQALFAGAALIAGDAAITAQLRRYGDMTITATQCQDHYLSYAKEPDDDWYDDDWGYNRLIANDDHFTVANVACGYSVAFVLQCFLVFFALVQAWVYIQIHRTAPNIGDGVGVFLVKDRGQSMQMHVRSPASSSREKGSHTVYKVTKKGESSQRQSGQQQASSSGRPSGRSSSGGGGARPKSAADRRESLTAARNASASPKKAPPASRSTDKPYDAYAADAGKYGYDDDDEDYV